MQASDGNRQGLYYGWYVVASGFVCAMLVIGATNYAFGLFVKPVSAELGLSRATMNTGLIILLAGMAIASPIVGRLLDRFPKPVIILAGAMLFALGFAVLAMARSPWVMAAALLIPTAFGVAGCGAFAAATTVARWFRRNRGKALGLTAVSSSAGGFVMVPVVSALIERLGWRMALVVVAAVVLVVIGLLAVLVIRDAPAALPDSEAMPVATTASDDDAEERAWTVPMMMRNRNFWLILLSVGLMLAVDQALLASLPAYGTDIGFTAAQSALLMSVLTFSALAGKAGLGFLADKVDKRWLMVAVAVCNLLFVLCLLVKPGYGITLATCSLIGIAVGGVMPVYHALVADHFGSRSFGAVLGLMTPFSLPLAMIALRFVGETFDRTGSYDAAFEVFMAVALLSILLVLLVRRDPAAVATGLAAAPARP